MTDIIDRIGSAHIVQPLTVEAAEAPEAIDLWGWAETLEGDDPRAREARDAVTARLFGELVKRGAGIIEHYHCDLYRDTQKLQQIVTGPVRFWWVARTWGTWLMADGEPGGEAVLSDLMHRSTDDQASGWWVDLTVTDRRWFATFTPIPNERI